MKLRYLDMIEGKVTEIIEPTTKKKIQVCKQNYILPIFRVDFLISLQEDIQQRQHIIKEGKRPERFFFWIKKDKKISFDERVSELEQLFKSYEQFGDLLKDYKNHYKKFLIGLTDELIELFTNKLQNIWQEEKNRDK